MESYFMTDEYVERRRAYVNEIRRSFDRPEVENGTAEEESQPLVPWIFLKIRIVIVHGYVQLVPVIQTGTL